MRVAVIHVGSNSVRLLIASVKRGGQVRELDRECIYLRLGDGAYRSDGSDAASSTSLPNRGAVRAVRAARAARIETIVTAPGRQAANADELVDLLADATRAPVVVLTAEDEGRLAWEGAVAFVSSAGETIGVVDLGGGSWARRNIGSGRGRTKTRLEARDRARRIARRCRARARARRVSGGVAQFSTPVPPVPRPSTRPRCRPRQT